MRVAPFVYFNEEAVAAEIPFPTLNGTVWDVWESDSGITLSGSVVTAWTGKQNSRVMNSYDNLGPIISSSNGNFNGYDSIAFDRTGNDGLTISGSNIQGVNTGSLYMCIFGITKYITGGGNFQTQFGIVTLGSPFNFIEAALTGESSTSQRIYRFQPPSTGGFTNSTDDTYGKGIYTIEVGPGTNASNYYNKGNTSDAAWTYTNYVTTRVRFAIGGYEIPSPTLAGTIDVVGAVIWYNSTDLSTDITDLKTYFETKYGI